MHYCTCSWCLYDQQGRQIVWKVRTVSEISTFFWFWKFSLLFYQNSKLFYITVFSVKLIMCFDCFFLIGDRYIHSIVLYYSEIPRDAPRPPGKGGGGWTEIPASWIWKAGRRSVFAHINTGAKPRLKSIFPCCIIQKNKIRRTNVPLILLSVRLWKYFWK
jgi:hypothetical protein